MGDVTTLYAQTFDANVRLLAQQMDSRLAQAATQGSHAGTKQAVAANLLGPITPRQRTTRYPELSPDDVPVTRRWVVPSHWFNSIWFDDIDALQILNDPKSGYVSSTAAALKRKKDDIFLAAYFADAITGETGTGTTAFATSTQEVLINFGASGSVNLTVKKLIEARRILLANEVDLDNEQVWCAINASAEASLLGETQVTSGDYFSPTRPVLTDGKLTRFLGINFIHSERIINHPTYPAVPVWVGSGMHFGMWQDIQTNVSQRMDREGLPWQVYTSASFGVSRIEETKTVSILCSQ